MGEKCIIIATFFLLREVDEWCVMHLAGAGERGGGECEMVPAPREVNMCVPPPDPPMDFSDLHSKF